jgi:hypothetical protein
VELLFSTHIGSVLAMAELLSPCSSAPIGLQPFRFVAMDSTELRKLRAAKVVRERQARRLGWRRSRRAASTSIFSTSKCKRFYSTSQI